MKTAMPYRPTVRSTLLLVAASCFLASCALFAPPPPKPTKHAKPKPSVTISAESYVENLSLAELSGPVEDEEADASAYVKTIQAYSAQKRGKSERQIIAVLDYNRKESGSDPKTFRHAAAPVDSEENPDFPSLLRVMNRLGETPYVLHDIRLLSATLKPGPSFALPKADIAAAITDQHQRLLLRGTPLSLQEEVRLQLALIRFFMENRLQDAAYLTVDNVKKRLAKAATDGDDSEQTRELSTQLEELETQLHKNLPLGAFSK